MSRPFSTPHFINFYIATVKDKGKISKNNEHHNYEQAMLDHAFKTHEDIVHGILKLEKHIAFNNFVNTTRLDGYYEEKTKIRSSWWRAMGIRANFGLLNGQVVCYRCNMAIDPSKGVSRLDRHLKSESHFENSKIFFASGLVPSPKIQFPITTSKEIHTPGTQQKFGQCPVI